eukprot:g4219.t1
MKAVPRPAFQEKRLHVSHDLLELHGYQPRGELGERYNAHRSGFIFHGSKAAPWVDPESQERISIWRADIWQLAGRIFDALIQELDLKAISAGHFSRHGPFDMVSHSQFQVKEMHPVAAGPNAKVVRLPLHQDPSFLSLLIHHSSEPPGQGCEFWLDQEQRFLPLARSGPTVCTVIIGQLFHLLLGRRSFAKGKHRVVTRAADMEKPRISATFFFQPPGTARL